MSMAPTPPDHRGDVLKVLGPGLLVTLLQGLLKDIMGLWFLVPTCSALIIWIVWAAANSSYLPFARRVALPVVAAAYGIVVVTISIVRSVPSALALNIVATVWIVAALAIFRLIDCGIRRESVPGYIGVAVGGLGLATIGVGVEQVGLGRTEFGAATIFMGTTFVAIGLALISGDRRLVGVAVLDWGVAVCCVGAATIAENDVRWWHGRFAIAEGTSLAVFGAALIVFGTALIIGERRPIGFSVCGVGVAIGGWGAVLLVFSEVVDGGEVAVGIAVSVCGIAVVLAGYAWGRENDRLFGIAGAGVGGAFLLYGTEGVVFLDPWAFGFAVVGLGAGALLGFAAYTAGNRANSTDRPSRQGVRVRRVRVPTARRHALVKRTARKSVGVRQVSRLP
ncbi:hypothetical protein [Nocardia brasiliensis]|uniref:hypothetical protein n=1 Tax=Nocardia brasiliensis TaxID=37326 RepID=UPI002453B1B1|nr:hypothetical protein [Nocardia brasiliensis]